MFFSLFLARSESHILENWPFIQLRLAEFFQFGFNVLFYLESIFFYFRFIPKTSFIFTPLTLVVLYFLMSFFFLSLKCLFWSALFSFSRFLCTMNLGNFHRRILTRIVFFLKKMKIKNIFNSGFCSF